VEGSVGVKDNKRAGTGDVEAEGAGSGAEKFAKEGVVARVVGDLVLLERGSLDPAKKMLHQVKTCHRIAVSADSDSEIGVRLEGTNAAGGVDGVGSENVGRSAVDGNVDREEALEAAKDDVRADSGFAVERGASGEKK
jgi:hypothetical protein